MMQIEITSSHISSCSFTVR